MTTPGASDLASRVAIITGGGSGLGAASAVQLAERGAAVVVTGRREHRLQDTVATVEERGGTIRAVPGDAGEPASADAAVAAALELGGVDVLVNNAGIHAHPVPTADIPIEEFDGYLRSDLRGPFLFMRAAIPHMLARGGGSIVNVSSIAGLIALKYTSSYAAAKGGLIALTRTAAIDYADRGIRVNCICPGGMGPTDPRHRTDEEDALMAEAYTGSPIGRKAHVDEVAALVVFLASPAGAAMTGTIIPVDGGYTAR